jgi:hypothetical protein
MPTLTERLRLGTNMHDRACHVTMGEAAAEIERLRAALIQIVEEKCDYMRINNLGDPDDRQAHDRQLAARAAVFEDCPNRRGLTEDESPAPRPPEGPGDGASSARSMGEGGAWPALTNAADD